MSDTINTTDLIFVINVNAFIDNTLVRWRLGQT